MEGKVFCILNSAAEQLVTNCNILVRNYQVSISTAVLFCVFEMNSLCNLDKRLSPENVQPIMGVIDY